MIYKLTLKYCSIIIIYGPKTIKFTLFEYPLVNISISKSKFPISFIISFIMSTFKFSLKHLKYINFYPTLESVDSFTMQLIFLKHSLILTSIMEIIMTISIHFISNFYLSNILTSIWKTLIKDHSLFQIWNEDLK